MKIEAKNYFGPSALHNFLKDVEARPMWQCEKMEFTITCYMVQGRVFLVQDRGADGWEIFIPAHNGNSIGITLNNVLHYLRGGK